MILLNKILFFIQTCFICFFVEFFMKIEEKDKHRRKSSILWPHVVLKIGVSLFRFLGTIKSQPDERNGERERREKKKSFSENNKTITFRN